MEVVKENESMLSNLEVYTLLKDIQEGRSGLQKPNKYQKHLSTIAYSTLKYLEQTPCADQRPEQVARFLKHLEPYKLTKAEKLQLLNQRPESAVEVLLLVEECEDRLTDAQIDEIIALVRSDLPRQTPATKPS